MTAQYLPPVKKPPHDPFRLPLDPRTGWREGYADQIEMSALDGALVLAPVPESCRTLNEASGSFGGLGTPRNVAIATDGSILLLHAAACRLKRFDPCECRFETVPCTGGLGSAPREFLDPGGIGICGGNLFVADTGNRRLQVFSLHGLVLRAFWFPPVDQVPSPWLPTDVAFDGCGRVLVADAANGCVHVFSAAGYWQRSISGVGAATAIIVDCRERLYVMQDPTQPVAIYDLTNGVQLGSETRADQLRADFPAMPFPVTAEGYLQLSEYCVESDAHGLFGANGEPVEVSAPATARTIADKGTWISDPLDSQLYRCQWDRLSVDAQVPDGNRIQVYSYSAETELSLARILDLEDSAWDGGHSLHAGQEANWDCLIRSVGGRYLWLKLVMVGDGSQTPRVHGVVLDFPRITLRRYLPAVFGAEAVSAEFSDRLLAVFDRGFRQMEDQLDSLPALFDPQSAPTGDERRDFLGWLASWIGIVLDRHLPVPQQRRLLKEAGTLFGLRGTEKGLRRMLELYMGVKPISCPELPSCAPCATEPPSRCQPPKLILEHFKLRRWLFLGAGHLGDQARLWGQNLVNRSQLGGTESGGNARLGETQLKTSQDPFRDPFHYYAHKLSIFIPGWIGRNTQRRKALERLIELEKPAHIAHQLIFVEPRFRIGVQSMIGFDAVVACYPQGVTLDQSNLGRATVIPASHEGGPTMRLGGDSRIGTSTRLN